MFVCLLLFMLFIICCFVWLYKTFVSVLNDLADRVALLENNSSIDSDFWGLGDDIRTTERKL